MNICIISPNPIKKDGIAEYSFVLADYLQKSGNKVIQITLKDKALKKSSFHYPLLRYSFLSIFDAYSLIRRKKIEVIDIQYAIPAFGILALHIWIIALLAKTQKIKVIVTFHEVNREIKLLNFLAKTYFWMLSHISNELIVHTKQSEKILISTCKISKQKIHYVPLFLKPRDKSIGHKKARYSKFLIAYFGYIHVDKGIEYLIESIKILLSTKGIKRTFHCVIAGDVRPRDGIIKFFEKKDLAYKTRLIDKVATLGLESYIEFKGFLSDKDMTSLLEDASIFVIPYTNTEQSGVLHTALPYCKPIIASNINGLSESLSGAGILVPPRKSEKIAFEISKLMNSSIYYQSICQKYKKIVRNLSIQNVAKEIIRIYES